MEVLKREIESDVEGSENTLVLSFASSAPYLRESKKFGGKYNEVLEISEQAVDFTRLVDQRCPLLLNHDPEKQVGVVNRAWIENEKLYCEVQFSEGGFSQQILDDVKQGIRRNVSIGYSIEDYEMIPGNPQTMLVKRWTPLEVSSCSIPADPTVGYQRSLETTESKEEEDAGKAEDEAGDTCDKAAADDTSTCAEETSSEGKACGAEEEKACEEAEEASRSEEANREEKQIDSQDVEIRSLGEMTGKQELAEQFIKDGKSLDDFKKEITTTNVRKENTKMEKFSIRKAILNAVGKLSDEEAAFERSVIAENKKKFNITDADIVVTKRDFDGTEAINQTVYQPGMYTPENRPAVTVDAIGTRKVAVAGPSISFSVCTSGLNAGFVDMNGNVPSASMAFELKTMTPKKEGAFVDVSYTSLLQDDPSAESIILDDITKALDQAKDAAFFNGVSGNNEPVGLLNVTGVNEVTLPATPTLSTALEFEKKIRESYDYSPNLKWIMGTGAYYQWASTPYSATEQNRMLVEDRRCIGYDVYVDANLPTSAVILGNWDEALEANFDGIVIRIVEDATLARKQAVEIVAHKAVDFCFRKPKSFTKSAQSNL